MTILLAEAQYGAAFNHWLNVTVRATRTAQVRHWWAARGIIVSRLMRVRFGPIHLTRELPRGHSRAMSAGGAQRIDQRDRRGETRARRGGSRAGGMRRAAADRTACERAWRYCASKY